MPSLLDKQERKENLAPVFKGTVDTANFQTIVGIVDIELLIATTALEHVAWALSPFGFSVPEANLRLPKPACVVKAI
jgi:hypothetical protein